MTAVKNSTLSLATFFLVAAGAGTYWLLRPTPADSTPAPAPGAIAANAEEDSPPKPAETDPPPDLPIVPWGKRGHFPVIRKPRYLPAEQGDRLLFAAEPVLGLVLNGVARAFPTNQLNEHEMVIDEINGTPVLVTY